jgi:hypothetical protein
VGGGGPLLCLGTKLNIVVKLSLLVEKHYIVYVASHDLGIDESAANIHCNVASTTCKWIALMLYVTHICRFIDKYHFILNMKQPY